MKKNLNERTSKLAKKKTDKSVIESFRSIRTNFIFATSKYQGCKKIIFSSSLPRDGKSTTCANLAVSLSQTGAKILLIDCDMRKPRMHRFFNCNNTPGLSNVLANFNQITEAIATTSYENLYLLPSGIIPPNPAELLASANMKNLIEGLENTFDYILLDTPPINFVSDALLLTKICNGVVLVVKQGFTPHTELVKTIKNLEFINADIIGIVLNEALEEKMKYKRYKYYGYGNNYEKKDSEFKITEDN